MPDNDKTLTPAMRQYTDLKKQYTDALLLFRMGDFYEVFFEDAKIVSRALSLVLTSRSKGDSAVPMAGFPAHSLEHYVSRLVQAGFRVAVCDQLEDPAEAKGLVERGVTRVITPGTLTEESLLTSGRNNFLLAVNPSKRTLGLAWLDLSTGRFILDEIPTDKFTDALTRIEPAECLVPDRICREDDPVRQELSAVYTGAVTARPNWSFTPDNARQCLMDFYETGTLDGFGLDGVDGSLSAAGALVEYLKETQKTRLAHIGLPERRRSGEVMELDRATISSLELIETMRTGDRTGSLLSVLDQTVTGMGARLLRQWLLWPLKRLEPIKARQKAVAELVNKGTLRARLRDQLHGVFDVERLSSRLGCQRADARDLVALGKSLAMLPEVKTVLANTESVRLKEIADRFDPMTDIQEIIMARLRPDPPPTLNDGGLIREGFSEELDRLHSIKRDGRKWLAQYQQTEIDRTGIGSLKVGYNKIFGYYIEIREAHADKVPIEYSRKQTLKNAERFITPELKKLESDLVNAEERAKAIEYQLFVELRSQLLEHITRLQMLASLLSEIDALASLAQAAVENGYTEPDVDDSDEIKIIEGRHPVIERTLAGGGFVPNDSRLDGSRQMLAVITGPNMAGKSTYIRQTALIVLMAQMGSFVPARSARVGLADAIFTRVGAADELSRGRSTFMVEMTETAYILNSVTERSLVIFDEVGRGTGTFDGLSIAWATCEYIVQKLRCRTLFATHYHQLTQLADLYHGVVNYNIAVREWQDKIIFLHKIVEGGTDKSYGIHVARLAGVPKKVVDRARRIMEELEEEAIGMERKLAQSGMSADRDQLMLSLFGSAKPKAADEIKKLNIDNLTPDEALEILKKLKN